MEEAFQWISHHIGEVIAFFAVFFEVSPIKLNPISWLLKWAGKAINGELRTDIQRIKEDAEEQGKAIDQNEMDRIRWEVLDFANSCRNKRRHSKDEFQHIIDINGKYHKLLDKYGSNNGVFEAEYEYIIDLYRKCQKEKDFL